MPIKIKLKFVFIGSLIIFILASISPILSTDKKSGINENTPFIYPDLSFFPPLPTSNNEPSIEGAELGRYLFYDPILSFDSTISCASCHRQEAAFSDAPKAFSSGMNGELMNRNTMPLFNLAWYPSFFWDGKAETIESQVFFPVRAHNEMNLNWVEAEKRINESVFYAEKFKEVFAVSIVDSISIAKAIGQFERTLFSTHSKYDRVLSGKDFFSADEYEGFVLINDQSKGDCLHCHTTDGSALGTITSFSNNGLESIPNREGYIDFGRAEVTFDNSDIGKFKIPSLRNLGFTAPYMHDGRFSNLEEVLDFYSSGVHLSATIDSKMTHAKDGGVHLTEHEKRKIIAFLNTMNDSLFISNPALSSPFK